MPIIIDTNCLPDVFSNSAKDHVEFKAVLFWILKGKGLIVIGGSKYMSELGRASKFLTIIRLLDDVGKVVRADKVKVDEVQAQVEEKAKNPDFDDPHLPALVIVTKCQIICSKDRRSIGFITDPSLYPTGIPTPVFYTSGKNVNLLSDKYVHSCFKPLQKLNKASVERVSANLI